MVQYVDSRMALSGAISGQAQEITIDTQSRFLTSIETESMFPVTDRHTVVTGIETDVSKPLLIGREKHLFPCFLLFF